MSRDDCWLTGLASRKDRILLRVWNHLHGHSGTQVTSCQKQPVSQFQHSFELVEHFFAVNLDHQPRATADQTLQVTHDIERAIRARGDPINARLQRRSKALCIAARDLRGRNRDVGKEDRFVRRQRPARNNDCRETVERHFRYTKGQTPIIEAQHVSDPRVRKGFREGQVYP